MNSERQVPRPATRVETVFLDAGGVLVFPNWSRVSERLAAQGIVVSPQQLAAAEPQAKRMIDNARNIATSNDQQRSFPYFNLVLEQAGVRQNDATDTALRDLHGYHAEHNLWESVPSDVPPALARLQAMGFRLVVVSNANGTIGACVERVGLSACLPHVFDSHVEGIEKPDRRFFDIALERTGAKAETTIHVGDIYHIDVVGARNASIRPVLLDPFGLYEDADCDRVSSLGALADALEAGTI